MDIGRRELLVGSASLGLATMVGSPVVISAKTEDLGPSGRRWHPLT
jgi:hypothetical protein